MKMIRHAIHKSFRTFGYQLTRARGPGFDPLHDMRQFLPQVDRPVIFDVGANQGQSVDSFRQVFPQATIHSFEPSPSTFQILQQNCQSLARVSTWNNGVGSREGVLPFIENTHSYMSSFLPPGETAWGEIARTTDVPVITLDAFATQHGVDYLHILKSDTQGYDLEVFRGATELMRDNRIGLIYFEIIFSQMYHGMPGFDETFRFLLGHNFQLVTFYRPHFQNDLVSWTDALFINRKLYEQRPAGISKR